ncbi:LCP family protein [Streptomyces sp. NPDC059740]|uniref:LCP family glycopolymer transferase n=1 Tax=Streptomyces sp. NPDC059740 TaxID=3346926 RepID=UPI00364A5ABB
MDAQGRGRGDDIDPADQWVFNPSTGTYELRLDPASDAPSPPSPRRPGSASGPANRTPRQGGPRQFGPSQGGPAQGGPPRGATTHGGGTQGAGAARTGPQGGSPTGVPRPGGPREGARGEGSRSGPAAGAERDSETRELPTQRDRRGEGSGEGGGRAAARRAAAAQGGGGRRKGKGPRTGKRSGKRKALYWTAGSMGFVLVVAGGFGVYLYNHLNNNIKKVDVGVNNKAVVKGPVNILLLGTDSREGKGNSGYGDSGSVGHADTTILLHISADRSNATALSIPRDLITDIPSCTVKQENGTKKTIPGQQGVRFNTSLGQEGRDPGCTWKTVKELTGLTPTHFMMADFNAIKELSTAVGGVEVCAAHDIDDPKSHLHLKAGRHVVEGDQALAFVRTRHTVGFGSDLSRIQLQQQFLSSLLRKMKSGDTLTSPSKLYKLSDAATKALTVDTGIGSASKLVDLAKDLSGVNVKNITFVTVPVLDNPDDAATVILDKAKAEPLFKMVQADHSLTKTKSKGGDDKKTAPVKKAPAAEVRVDVSNGGGPIGAAQDTVEWLQNNKGAKLSTNAGNAPATVDKTVLEYAPNQADQAATLADWMGLPKSAMKKSGSNAGAREPMKLTLGKDYSGAGEPIEAPTTTPDGVQNVNADDKNVCAK